jgi:hypothetical protein
MIGRWGRAKRIAWLVACGAALLVGGCDTAKDSQYLKVGIGTDLYWDGLPAATELQDIYLANICAQAISPTASTSDVAICEGLTLGSRDWGLIVQAGMNDIDLRCDGYLAWLHDKRSSREPILKQLAAMGGATAAILKATEVGPTPIALAGIAFGLAAETFTNVDMRLLNGVDYTTVQSVVRDNRTRFRGANLSLVIDNRPAAIYVLRNYMSICMPSSIEMSINNTVNVFHTAGSEALRIPQIALRTAAATATSSTSASVRGVPVVIRADRPPPPTPTPTPANLMDFAVGSAETSITRTRGKELQKTLCVPETGAFDTATRAQLRAFNVATHYPKDDTATDQLAPADLTLLNAAQNKFPSCEKAGFQSGFEVGLFTTVGAGTLRSNLRTAVTTAKVPAIAGLDADASKPADSAVRDAIAALRKAYQLPGLPVFDRMFYDTMMNNIVR